MVANLTTRLGQLTSSPAGGPYTGANKIINGDMIIDQRNAGASVTLTNTSGFATDRFSNGSSGLTTQTFACQQVTSTLADSIKSLKGTIGGTGAAPAAAAYVYLSQKIEGLNCTDLLWGTASAKAITVSFRAKYSVTGTYGIAFRNSSGDRSYISSFALTANTDTLVTATIPGDTTGTWLTTNGVGLMFSLDLGVGTTYSATAGSWQAGNFLGLTGGTKLCATTGATAEITNVKVEVGSIATPFAPDDYQVSFAKCQRYYQVRNNSNSNIFGNFYTTTQVGAGWSLPVVMRSTPTITVASGAYYTVYWNNQSQALSSFLTDTATTTDVAVYQNSGITGTAGMAVTLRISAVGGAFILSAEL